MDTVNRSAIVVRPRQRFLDWLDGVDPTSTRLGLQDLQREPTAFLVPECDSREPAIEYWGECVTEVFEEQLDGWYLERLILFGEKSLRTAAREFVVRIT
jgi:hypothetical protein